MRDVAFDITNYLLKFGFWGVAGVVWLPYFTFTLFLPTLSNQPFQGK